MNRAYGLIAVLAVASSAQAAVPPAIAVPGDPPLVLSVTASGVQIYDCLPGKGEHAGLVWVLKAPEATLADESGAVIGKHYAGPSWELSDGSKVVGELVAKDPGPRADAIPWLLVKIVDNSGVGKLASARLIQRVETQGGVAPSGACMGGQQLRMPYSAVYKFFAAP